MNRIEPMAALFWCVLFPAFSLLLPAALIWKVFL